MKKLSLAYFATPYFAADLLEKLLSDQELAKIVEVKLIVTQPDKPVGRKQKLTESPVKLAAEKFGLDVFNLSIRKLQSAIDKLKRIDLALLYAYGEIIPDKLIAQIEYGFWNIHPSLLPKYRGSSPMAYPLLLGDKKTGVTLIKLDGFVDHGPIIAKEETQISSTEKRPDLEIKLSALAFKIFKETIQKQITGNFSRFQPTLQDHKNATFTRRLTKEDGFIPFSILKKAINNQPLEINEIPNIVKDYYVKNNLPINQFDNIIIYNLFRGLFPWPGIWTKIRINNQEKRLKITNLTIDNYHLVIDRIQLEGKKEVDFPTFNRAYKII